MRTAEWINFLAFSFLTLLAWRRIAEPRRRIKVTLLGGIGLALTGISAGILPRALPPLAASVCRDWLPYILLLLFYWQAGQFYVRVDLAVQRRLEHLDQRLITAPVAWCARGAIGRGFLTVFESAYLFCYPALPLGLGALYILRRGREADHFWAVVLAATYFCYGLLPFIQTQPPRVRVKPGALVPQGAVRSLNLWVLRHASIQANTFPSAHVASSTACALVVLRVAPPVGWAFLVLAVCIALGAVAGRYHYTADVLLGAVVAVIASAVEARL